MATVILEVIPTGTGPDTDTDTRPAIIGIIIVAFTDTTIIGNSRTIRSN